MTRTCTHILTTLTAAVMLLATALCAGCSNDHEAGAAAEEAEHPISFTASAPSQYATRSAIVDTEDLQAAGSFGVFAYLTETTPWAEAKASNPKPEFMYNQKVTWNSTNWTYDPLKYWPNYSATAAEPRKVSFFAYAPYATAATHNTSYQPEVSYTWTAMSNPGNQADLLYARRTDCYKTMAEGYGAVNGRVPLNFSHALAALDIRVRRRDASTTTPIYLRGLEVSGTLNTSGTLNLVTTGWTFSDNGSSTITYADTDINATLQSSSDGVTATTDEEAHPVSKYTPSWLLLMPKDGALTLNFNLSYTVGLNNKDATIPLTFSSGLAMGRKYTVVLVINAVTVEGYVLNTLEAEQW